ncbi:MAG: SsrA-binding protein SmpB [Chlamydiae bacterium]|jgi:SsrA-binding protein|nr:SsrA-binding protein SmpB [Chlamydiota bacterium]
METKEIVSNRSAYHHYEVLEVFEAGIALQGTEVKSLKSSHANLQDNFITIKSNEAFLKNASIAPYRFGNIHNHEEKRDRKLLFHKEEILKLRKLSEVKGHTLIALSFYLKKGIVKVKVGVCRGKKTHDKREDEKKRSQLKEIKQAFKNS